jgi:hypothetical protein
LLKVRMRASRKKEHILQKENTKGNKEEAVCASIQRGHILQSAHEQGTIGEEEEEALLAVDAFLGDLLSGGGGGAGGSSCVADCHEQEWHECDDTRGYPSGGTQ